MDLVCLEEGLSMVADTGMGLEPGEADGASLVAIALADRRREGDPSDVCYRAVRQQLGCTVDVQEAAAMLDGDEFAVKRAAMGTDFGRRGAVLRTYLPHQLRGRVARGCAGRYAPGADLGALPAAGEEPGRRDPHRGLTALTHTVAVGVGRSR